jgi:hypothetical protein
MPAITCAVSTPHLSTIGEPALIMAQLVSTYTHLPSILKSEFRG